MHDQLVGRQTGILHFESDVIERFSKRQNVETAVRANCAATAHRADLRPSIQRMMGIPLMERPTCLVITRVLLLSDYSALCFVEAFWLTTAYVLFCWSDLLLKIANKHCGLSHEILDPCHVVANDRAFALLEGETTQAKTPA
jgi:hypothetical protein